MSYYSEREACTNYAVIIVGLSMIWGGWGENLFWWNAMWLVLGGSLILLSLICFVRDLK